MIKIELVAILIIILSAFIVFITIINNKNRILLDKYGEECKAKILSVKSFNTNGDSKANIEYYVNNIKYSMFIDIPYSIAIGKLKDISIEYYTKDPTIIRLAGADSHSYSIKRVICISVLLILLSIIILIKA